MDLTQDIWDREVYDKLHDLYINGNLPHTVIVSGNHAYAGFQNIWKLSCAMLCENEGTQACGTCAHCSQAQQLIHPDLHVFFPNFAAKETCDANLSDFRNMAMEQAYFNLHSWMEQRDKLGKQPNINTDNIDEIMDSVALRSKMSDKRILIIWGAEYLRKEGNKLLKLIEEPPENTFIFLLVSSDHQLLSTIRSRGMLIKVPAVQKDRMQSYLNAYADLPEFEEVIQLADGNPVWAQQLLEGQYRRLSDEWLNLLRVAYKGHPTELVALVDQLAALEKSELTALVDFGLAYNRSLLRYHLQMERHYMPKVDQLSQLLSVPYIMEMTSELEEIPYLIQRNAHVKMLWYAKILKITEIFNRAKKVMQRT